MVTISPVQPVVTLILVHRCEPDDQATPADLLADAAERVYSQLPGFVSATIHRSLDGLAVTNYTQYRSRDSFDNIRDAPGVAEVIAKVQPLLMGFEAHLYEVAAQQAARGVVAR